MISPAVISTQPSVRRALCAACLVWCAFACSRPSEGSRTPIAEATLQLPLPGTDGETHTLQRLSSRNKWTVLVFFSDTCPTVKAHDARVNALARRYASQGVGFYWIDSELDATLQRDTLSAQRRSYLSPILLDERSRIANALNARYASHAFILNTNAEVVYEGGIDSDKKFLHADATPYLANALDRLLNGETPEVGDSRALGCALRR